MKPKIIYFAGPDVFKQDYSRLQAEIKALKKPSKWRPHTVELVAVEKGDVPLSGRLIGVT